MTYIKGIIGISVHKLMDTRYKILLNGIKKVESTL